MRRPSPALVVAVLALFVALGGPGAEAAKRLFVGSKQIKDGSIAGKDLQPSLVKSLRATADRSISAAKLADDAVTGKAVGNGTLDGKDVGRFAGIAQITLGAETNGCTGGTTAALKPLVPDQDISNDAIVVTPPASLPNGVTVTARPQGKDRIHVTACGAAAPGGDFNFRYVSMDVAG